jgi:hypothetical protein
MSRYSITTPSGEQFVYGYDRPTQQYFLDCVSPTGNPDIGDIYLPWVGFDSCKPEWARGTNVNLLMAMDHFNLLMLIPTTHRLAICMDLPIPDPVPAL